MVMRNVIFNQIAEGAKKLVRYHISITRRSRKYKYIADNQVWVHKPSGGDVLYCTALYYIVLHCRPDFIKKYVSHWNDELNDTKKNKLYVK